MQENNKESYSINNRISRMIEYLGKTRYRISQESGISEAVLNNIDKNKNKASLDVIVKLLNKYSAINPEWLLLGEGEMLKGNSNTLENPDSSALINEKERIISMLEAQIKMLQAQIEIKDGQIKELLKQRAADGAKDTTSAMAG